MRPLVSAIIPTRNRPATLSVAVHSALNQTYPNLEVVVVVDGPDEATVEMLDALQVPGLRVVALAENVGGSEARNVGVRSARGEWIALLDDDDEWLPEKIEKQMALAAAEGSENTLISCRYYFRRNGKPDRIKPGRLPKPDEEVGGYIFDTNCALNTSTYLCPRNLFLKVPFEKGLPCLQDFDWYIRIMGRPNAHLMVAPEPLTIYNDPAGRSTITGKRTWDFAFHYAKSHRNLMTKRTYALFIVKCCVRLAVRQKAGPGTLLEIFAEMFRFGSPSLKTVGLFLLFCIPQ